MLSIFLPRGIRNNNPGNLRLSKTVWLGQRSSLPAADRDFAEFSTALYGLRALMKNLLTYYLKHDLDTVECIINRFAPPHENDTDGYIRSVAKVLGVRRTEKTDLTLKPVLTALARAIVLHENGPPPKDRPSGWYASALYDQAADLVLPLIV
jgi:hypothetical protein